MSGSNISGGNISGVAMSGSNISGGNISGVAMSGSNISGGNISGVAMSGSNISGGNISGLVNPIAVADGGTNSTTLPQNAVILGNGVGALKSVSPGTSGNLLVDNGTTWVSQAPAAVQVFGSTWTDVTGSRSQGVTYTNTTGKFIQVQGNFGCNGGGQGQIYINGVLISFWAAQFNGCGGYSVNMPCIVPPGATYMLASMGGAARGWYELI
jgi:uncharacterized protein YjbI with pentapeptide repeats